MIEKHITVEVFALVQYQRVKRDMFAHLDEFCEQCNAILLHQDYAAI